MIKEFSVKGFKQFGKQVTLNFSNVRDYDFSNECLSPDKKFIKTALIYGPNASGKSNLGYALFDIVQHLVDRQTIPIAYSFYLNADTSEQPAKFHYLFSFDGCEVEYNYSKVSSRKLVAEELLISGKPVFYWDDKKEEFSNLKDFGFGTLNKLYKNNSISFLRYLANNSVLDNKSPIKSLFDFVGSMLWFTRTDQGNGFIGFHSQPTDMNSFFSENGKLHTLESFLNKHDVEEKLEALTGPDGKTSIYSKHKHNLPFFDTASSGTMALTIFSFWQNSFKHISMLFIDEFDAFYHSKVAEQIFRDLTKINKPVILTTHNTNLLKNTITRPDCCFELSQGQLKSFADSTDRQIRQGNNLERLYLSGEFDA